METEKEIKREIRKALLGELIPVDDGLAIAGSRIERLSHGIADGAGGVLFFGVMRQVRRYRLTDEEQKQTFLKNAEKALLETGRKFFPQTVPESLSIVRNFVLTRPAVAILTLTDTYAQLAVYSARGISGLISTFRVRRSFETHMPEGSLQRIEYSPAKERAEELARERAEQEARKAEEAERAAKEQEMRLAEEQAYFAAQQQWMQQMQMYQMQQQQQKNAGAPDESAATQQMPVPPVPPAWMMQQMMQQQGMWMPGQQQEQKKNGFRRRRK